MISENKSQVCFILFSKDEIKPNVAQHNINIFSTNILSVTIQQTENIN